MMKIVIMGDPIPKMRARHARFKSGLVHTYDPQHHLKQCIQEKLRAEIERARDPYSKSQDLALSRLVTARSLSASINFHMQLPKDPCRASKCVWGIEPHNIKPDIDNLVKFILDCCNDILFSDDKIITTLNVTKTYSTEPRTEIDLMPNDMNIPTDIQDILKHFSPSEIHQFVEDVNYLSKISESNLSILPIDQKEKYLLAVAKILSNISKEYAGKLNKILKVCNQVPKKEKQHDGKI